MADVIIGKRVINKVKEIGTIIAFEDNIIHVEFDTRTVNT